MWCRYACLFVALSVAVESFAQDAPQVPVSDEPPLVSPSDAPRYVFPQRRESEGYSLVLYAPQIRSWPDFASLEAQIALELTPPDGSPASYGTASVTGATEIDLEQRIVTVREPKIGVVVFPGNAPAEYGEVVQRLATRKELEIPLDLFLAQLADDVLSSPPPAGFNDSPPRIFVTSTPTLLLLVNGSPVLTDVADSGLKLLVNANWPIFQDSAGTGPFYLLDRDQWLSSAKLESGWEPTTSLPAGFAKLPPGDEFAAVRAAVPLKKSDLPAPTVIFTSRPAELIVTDGQPRLETIPGTDGLEFVANTPSPIFKLDKTWYFLVAGRWFTTSDLSKGPWTYTAELPTAFAKIPDDHAMASVLASVPGTVEAKMAALEALLPTRTDAARDAKPPVEVTYAGEPQFEPVPTTQLTRAVNTGYDVLQYNGFYYLCYAGIWYEGTSPNGPWAVTASVPAEIYKIPPSSPAYHVTQVTVVNATPASVVYEYPAAYSSSVYVVYGVPYYGTGWYYPPYIYGGYYYPYWGSYGHGSWYNPATGGYGSRSVWYGPYGGYSYTQGYNPTTGRYGYMETAWDSNEWASSGGTYNPRTGVSTATSRYYNANSNSSSMSRTVQRGDQAVSTQRNTDFDQRSTQVQRTTSGGGQSNMQRQANDGTVSSSGTIMTGDGRSYTVEGEQTRQGGSSTITGAEGSADITTKRNDGRSISSIEGSGGGQGISMSGQGPGRTTIGQSGSGDVYAGHDGNVYKKTDDGWQHYDDGGWNPVDTPDRAQGDTARQQASSTAATREASRPSAGQSNLPADNSRQRDQARRQAEQRGSGSGRYPSQRDMSQLNRDRAARQRGNSQFQRRSGGYQRGGGMQRGGRGGGRGGGRRR